jgi:hypothetical protein
MSEDKVLRRKHMCRKTKRMYWLTEDVIMEFLPPGDERRMNY